MLPCWRENVVVVFVVIVIAVLVIVAVVAFCIGGGRSRTVLIIVDWNSSISAVRRTAGGLWPLIQRGKQRRWRQWPPRRPAIPRRRRARTRTAVEVSWLEGNAWRWRPNKV
jgi:hypothetical protein